MNVGNSIVKTANKAYDKVYEKVAESGYQMPTFGFKKAYERARRGATLVYQSMQVPDIDYYKNLTSNYGIEIANNYL